MLTDVVTIRFCPTNKNAIPLNADNYLICRLNNLLDNFSPCDSNTLSVIFQIYCMNVYMAVRYDSFCCDTTLPVNIK